MRLNSFSSFWVAALRGEVEVQAEKELPWFGRELFSDGNDLYTIFDYLLLILLNFLVLIEYY